MGTGSSKDDALHSQSSDKPFQNKSENSENTAKATDKSKEAPVCAENRVLVKFPHNYDAIVKDADSPVDNSSTNKLYDQLFCGVFLNQKRKKYWVEKISGSNSFMLFARGLLITWAEDTHYWKWISLNETSDVIVDAAELVQVCWLEAHARFDTTKLSPGISYQVVFVIMLKDPAYGWDVPVNLRLLFPNVTKQEHKENLMKKPRNQWIEIPVGEFKTSTENENAGEMEISMYEYEGGKWKKGLVIRGVIIRPKN